MLIASLSESDPKPTWISRRNGLILLLDLGKGEIQQSNGEARMRRRWSLIRVLPIANGRKPQRWRPPTESDFMVTLEVNRTSPRVGLVRLGSQCGLQFRRNRNVLVNRHWRSERGQRENAALNVARTRDRHIDVLTVCRGGDAIEACIVQRAVKSDAADRYHVAVLTHADDRVVASIGDIEI